MDRTCVAVPFILIRDGKKQHVGRAVMNRYTYKILDIQVDPTISLTDEEKELLAAA